MKPSRSPGKGLTFWALAALLALLPMVLAKPGLPVVLQFGEAETFLAASSLAFDFDLDCERHDLERLFFEYAYAGEQKLRLGGQGEQLRLAEPPFYAGLGAPFVAAFGSNGLRVLNALLLMASIALIGQRLEKRIGRAGRLVATLALLLSPAFAYIFWLSSTLLAVFLVATAFALGWVDGDERPRFGGSVALAGLALALAAALQPFLLVLAIPLLINLAHDRDPGRRFLLGLTSGLLLVGLCHFVAWDSLAAPPQTLFSFTKPGDEPRPLVDIAEPSAAKTLFWGLTSSLIERRSGFLPYFPWAVLALIWGWPHSGRGARFLVAILGLLVLTQPWIGLARPEVLTNPALLPLLPAFLFLIKRFSPRGLLLTCALSTFLLGPILTTALGSPVPNGGLHTHTRVQPFPLLPLDPAQIAKDAGGFVMLPLSGYEPAAGRIRPRLWAPADQAEVHGEELWLAGGEKVELFLETAEPISEGILQIRVLQAPARVDLRGEKLELRPETGAVARRALVLPGARRGSRGTYFHRFEIASKTGIKQTWLDKNSEEDFFVGAIVTYLGERTFLETDLFAAEWSSCAPSQVAPGQEFELPIRVRNIAAHLWPARGAARVRVQSRWLDEAGRRMADNPPRSLPADVAPGAEVEVTLKAKAPTIPGRYVFETDLVFEAVAFFSDRGVPTCRSAVEIR